MISKKTVRKVLIFANQPEQKVLGFDGRTAKLAGFVTSEEDNPPGSLSISFEHKFLILSKCRVLRLNLILIEPPKSNKRRIRLTVCFSENTGIQFPNFITLTSNALIVRHDEGSETFLAV